LIPETYHRFAQKQEAGLIQPVLEHNKLDLLTWQNFWPHW
jgi:uncharacterized protein YprB with RNaseH-like and TPR domain